jgi:hypothetical protein
MLLVREEEEGQQIFENGLGSSCRKRVRKDLKGKERTFEEVKPRFVEEEASYLKGAVRLNNGAEGLELD